MKSFWTGRGQRRASPQNFGGRAALVAFLLATVWLAYRAHQLEHSLKEKIERPGTALLGKPAPEFSLPVLVAAVHGSEGVAPAPVALAAARGKIVFVSFWASWCRPCDYELPLLNQFYLAQRERGVEVIAISTDEDRTAALRYVEDKQFALPMVWDEGGRVAEQYQVEALPTLVVIGPEGYVRQYERGLRMDLESWLDAQVRAIFPKGQPPAVPASSGS